MTQRLLFCDFDGPIVNVAPRYYATYHLCLRRLQQGYRRRGDPLDCRCLSPAQFWTFKQNRVPDRQIAHWSGLSGATIDEFLQLVQREVNGAALLHHDQVQPWVQEAFGLLQQMGIRVVVVTLRPPHQVRQFLRHHHLEGHIADLFGMGQAAAAYANQADHKVERLASAIEAQRRLGYDPAGAWMVGDTEADILAGQAAGLETVALTCGIRSASYLQRFRPTRTLNNLWAVAQTLQQHLVVASRP